MHKLYHHVNATLCYLPCIDVEKGQGTTKLVIPPRCRHLPNRNTRWDQFRGKDTTMTFTSFEQGHKFEASRVQTSLPDARGSLYDTNPNNTPLMGVDLSIVRSPPTWAP